MTIFPGRILLAAFIVAGHVIPASAQVNDVPPSTPSNLQANVYGTSSVGIRWGRSVDDRGAVRGYEITRNGAVLGIRDALSLVDNDVVPGTRYEYKVAAVDSANQRSAPARVVLTTRDARPITVDGLRVQVYSATAVGLAWTRAEAVGTRYEIRRDGNTVALTDGTSYIDQTLDTRRRYLFEVIAVNRQGERATSARIFVDTRAGTTNPGGPDDPVDPVDPADPAEPVDPGEPTPPVDDNPFASPDPNGTSIISFLGYEDARETADDLVTTAYLYLYYNTDFGDLLDLDPARPDVRTCPGGGTVAGTWEGPFRVAAVFNSCGVGGRTFDGGLNRLLDFAVFGGGSAQTETVVFDGLRIDGAERGVLNVKGVGARRDSSVANPACEGAPTVTRAFNSEIAAATLASEGNLLTIDSADWTQTIIDEPVVTPPSADAGQTAATCRPTRSITFEGSTLVSSRQPDTSNLTITKRGDILRDPANVSQADALSSARLDADGSAGLSLRVTATSDAAGEARVDIVSDGVSVSFSDDYRFDARDDIPTILGD